MYRPPVGVDGATGNGEPQAETTRPPGVAAPVKGLEHGFQLIGGHPRAAIPHPQPEDIAVGKRADLNESPVGGVLHRIADHVLEGTLNKLSPDQGLRLASPFETQVAPQGMGLEARIVGNGRGQIDQVHGLARRIAPIRVQARQGQ
nr:hypothetical protein [Zoogloea sp.]